MDGPDLADELDQARGTLAVAYDRARATGYQPDSLQMLDLQLAEKHYENAKGRRNRDDTRADQGTGAKAHTSRGVAGGSDQVSRVIDLRENGLGAGKPQPGPAATSNR